MRFRSFIADRMRRLLRDHEWRNRLCIARTILFSKLLRRGMRYYGGDQSHVSANTVRSNARRVLHDPTLPPHPRARFFWGVDLDQSGRKSDLLIVPALQSVPGLKARIADTRVLSVGPRTEGELFNLFSHGFRRRNIVGLDLFSYSPWIKLGDMHAMPFEDDSFDLILLGWCLAYSDNKTLAAREAMRVLKPGGTICVGVSYSPKGPEEVARERGYSIGSGERLEGLKQTVYLFGPFARKIAVRFGHDIADRSRPGQIIAVFTVEEKNPDRIAAPLPAKA